MTRFVIFYLLFHLSSCAVQSPSKNQLRQQMIENAKGYLGTPYKSKLNNGFDCSGFVQFCFNHIGIQVPRSSTEQSTIGEKKKLSKVEIGDILIFTGSNKKKRKPGHSALVYEIRNDSIFFIHATLSKGIMINNLNQQYYSDRFLSVVDFIDR